MTFARILYTNAEQAEFLAESAFRRGDWAAWLDAVGDLMSLVDDYTKEARAIRSRMRRNPFEYPASPKAWVALVEGAIKTYHALRRQARRAQGRVTKNTFKRMLAKIAKQEQNIVLMVRTMRADFMEKWPQAWTDKRERSFWPWYGKKLR